MSFVNRSDNFIYFHHLNKLIYIPSFPDSLDEKQSATFAASTPLGRSAPIYSWGGSGPRTVTFSFNLHRDMMSLVNGDNDHTIDEIERHLESMCLPRYSPGLKMIDPPLVTVRIMKEMTITGIVQNVSKTKSGGERDGRYMMLAISFSVDEANAIDAESSVKIGSYRGINTSLDRMIRGG